MTAGKSDLIDIIIDLKAAPTGGTAILVSDGVTEAWVPLSQIEYERNGDGTYTVTGPEWLFMDKGLI